MFVHHALKKKAVADGANDGEIPASTRADVPG
jgi:hypothetical protein